MKILHIVTYTYPSPSEGVLREAVFRYTARRMLTRAGLERIARKTTEHPDAFVVRVETFIDER